MAILPCVQVRDLPPSASFYSAVTQPLGLRFTSANSGSIVFGNPDPTFEVKAVPAAAGGPKPTRIVLSASSPSAVSAFHAAAKRANPKGNAHISLKENDGSNGESRASATDLEGNIVEIVYPGSTAGYTQSSSKQVTRILSWNLDAASSALGATRSVAGSVAPSRPGLATLLPADDDATYRIIRRSLTTSTFESAAPQQQESKGLSTGAMMGTVLGAVAAGVAVGAGITYALSKKDRGRAPRQEYDTPPFQRRASYPEPHPDQQPRYVELERTVEKVRYPEQYPPGSNRYAHPAYTTRNSQADIPPVEEVDERDDPASRRASHTRDRSAGGSRERLMISEMEHRSNVGSQKPEVPAVVEPPRAIEPPRIPEEEEEPSQTESKHTNAKSQLHAELFKRTSPKASPKAPSEAPDKESPKESPKDPDTRSRVSSRSKHDDDRRSHVSSRSKHDDDRRSHGSRSKHDDDRRSHVSSRSKHDDDRRSHGSRSKHDDDHRSHVSRSKHGDDGRSHVSSRSKHHDDDRRSKVRSTRDTEASTYVSARSEKSAGTVRPSTKAPSRAPSYVSAKDAPKEDRDDWNHISDDDDDDKVSVAPSDSISCVGERPKPHARDLPFLQTRERIIIQ